VNIGEWIQCLLGRAAPTQPKMVGPSPAQLKNFQNFKKQLYQKNLWFSEKSLLHFDQYWFVLLYYKDTNLVLKYPVFVKTLKKKYFFFMHMAKSLKNKNKNHIWIQKKFKNMY
jgi:hypothetical protein